MKQFFCQSQIGLVNAFFIFLLLTFFLDCLNQTKCLFVLVYRSSGLDPSLTSEYEFNDIALNQYGTLLYAASSRSIRIWDLRMWVIYGFNNKLLNIFHILTQMFAFITILGAIQKTAIRWGTALLIIAYQKEVPSKHHVTLLKLP